MKHGFILYHLFFFIFLLIAGDVAGRTQPICRIRHYSVSDGLSQSFVQRICQSPDGLLWFGTWNGLNTYDGYSFTNHNMSSPGGGPLSTNRIIDIHMGKSNDVWCQTYDGRVYLFLSREQRFVDVLASADKRLGHKVEIKDVHVLPKGVVWLVGERGYAFRLDEERFKAGTDSLTFYRVADHTHGGSRVLRIFEDSEDDEWILTDSGVDIVGRKRVKGDSISFHNIKERGGRVYLVSSSNKLAAYRPETSDFAYSDIPCESPIVSLKGLGRDTLLLQADDALVFYSEAGGFSSTLRIGDYARRSASISNLYVDKDGMCWLLLDRYEMLRLNPRTMEVKFYTLPSLHSDKTERKSRSLIFQDRNSMLWVIPEHGAMCYYDAESDAFYPYLLDEQDASSAYIPFIRYSAFDRQGNLWYASGTGLEQISFLSSFFTLHALEKDMDVRAFLKDSKGRLWVGSQSGIVRVRMPDGKQFYLSPDGTLMERPCVFSGGAYALLEDSRETIWLGTKKDGLYRLRPLPGGERYEVVHYKHDSRRPYSLSSNSVYALFQDSRGQIWVGTFGGGLNLVVEGGDGQLRFVHSANRLAGYPSERATRVRCIAEAPGGTLLVGTTDGLLACRLSSARPEDIRFCVHRHRADDKNSLNSNDIMDIFVREGVESSESEVYALGFTGGLNILSPDSLLDRHAAFRHYTEQDGLISNLVHSMSGDGHGFYWVVAEDGLSLFDPNTKHCVNYRSEHFFPGLKFAETVPLLLDDKLLLGTNLGVLELDLPKLPHNTYVPPVLLTEVRLQGRLLHRDANQLEELVLPSHQRNVSFRFSAVEFINPVNIRYAYRLKGLEEGWNEVGNTRSANYMNLPAGTYTFEVRSTNSDGLWMDNARTLRLVVEPKFTETGWAWVLYAAIFLLLVGTVCYVLFYIYRLRHRIDLEHQLSDIKLRFFTDISHELRTPLTLISSPVNEALEDDTLSEKTRENLTLAKINTQRMLRMMNQILDFRKVQNRKMKLIIEEHDLLQLLHQVMEHFQAMARSKHIRFELLAPVPSLVMWLDVDKVEKIFFNLVSNAFKYTPDDKAITIKVQPTATEVQVEVADQGIGIDAAHRQKLFHRFENFAHSDMWSPSSGIGLSLVKELVTLHHGHIDVESRVDEGSRFIVTLPLDKAVYAQDKQVEFILNDGPTVPPVPAEKAGTDTALPEKDTPTSERLTLLVVEDNAELRLFLRNILSDTYRVLEACDGQRGLDLAVKHVPDFIITDVMMPVMDGLDMVKRLKENRMVCHIPVIVLSAKSSLDDRIAGLEHGIDDYIAKPFSSTYLKARIVSLLRQRRQLQELYMNRLADQDSQPGKVQSAATYEPSLPELESLDEQFMKSVMEFLEANMSNQELEIENLAEHLFMSRTVFYRKLKPITGLTPVEFVREIRLKRAIQLMESDDYTISQVAYMTGFRAPKYFSKVFKKATGLTPSEYKEKKGEKA